MATTTETLTEMSGLEKWKSCQYHIVHGPFNYEHFIPLPQPRGFVNDFSCFSEVIVDLARGYSIEGVKLDQDFAKDLRGKPMYGFIRPGDRISTNTVRLHVGGFDDDSLVHQALNKTCAKCPFYKNTS